MANIASIKQVKSMQEFGNLYNPSALEYKELIREFIRLDIPFLEIGSSSIGKSYSLREFMEECGVNGEFLFVGTEKSEFIEGIPNLKAVAEATVSGKEEAQKFSYLKPYWFPDKKQIRNRLINGRKQLADLTEEKLQKLWKGSQLSYDMLLTLKQQLLTYRRSEKDLQDAKEKGTKISKYIYSDALSYISMLQGFGNFWLVLDEIDKVEKMDKDKYAPLLHIVRERELKGWKLSGLRDFPEFDIKFVSNIDSRIKKLDQAIDNEDIDITDTRVIGIANDLRTMEKEAPALYRRFVKVVINRSLYDEKREKKPIGNPTKDYEIIKDKFHSCIAVKQIPGKKIPGTKKDASVQDLMAAIAPELTGKPLDELNLQWTLGFLPDMLFPGLDASKQSGKFIPNEIIRNWNNIEEPYQTVLFKIISDNFEFSYWNALLECIDNLVAPHAEDESKKSGIQATAIALYEEGGLMEANYNNPPKAGVDLVLKSYKDITNILDSEFKKAGTETQLNMRKKKTATGAISGLAGSVLQVAKDKIKLGNLLIEKSLIDNKPTALTEQLVSGIPFIQTSLISSSPYISHTYAMDLLKYINDFTFELVQRTTGQEITNETKAEDLSKKLFEVIKPSKEYVIMYGVGLTPEMEKEISALLPANTPDMRKKKDDMIDKIIANRPIIVNETLLTKLSIEQKKRYHQNIAAARMIEKEEYENLAKTFELITNEYKSSGLTLTEPLKKDITDYCQKFPYKMRVLAGLLPKEDAGIGTFIIDQSDKAIANNLGREIDSENAVKEPAAATA